MCVCSELTLCTTSAVSTTTSVLKVSQLSSTVCLSSCYGVFDPFLLKSQQFIGLVHPQTLRSVESAEAMPLRSQRGSDPVVVFSSVVLNPGKFADAQLHFSQPLPTLMAPE